MLRINGLKILNSLCMIAYVSHFICQVTILMVMFFIIKSAGVCENVQTSANGQTGFFNCLHEDTESIFFNIRIATAATQARLILERHPERKKYRKRKEERRKGRQIT